MAMSEEAVQRARDIARRLGSNFSDGPPEPKRARKGGFSDGPPEGYVAPEGVGGGGGGGLSSGVVSSAAAAAIAAVQALRSGKAKSEKCARV